MSDSETETLCRATINQYLKDPLCKRLWPNLDINSICDADSAMRYIFMHGACVDFANAISDSTGWPIYEIQWGDSMIDDPNDCQNLKGVHRVIRHPSGRYFDASGWTDMETVLGTFNAKGYSYKWMDEVDHGADIFNVDYALIKSVVIYLMPEGCMEPHKVEGKSTSRMKM